MSIISPPPPPAPKKSDRIERLVREAAELRAKAAAGERPRFHNRHADLCERLICQLQSDGAS